MSQLDRASYSLTELPETRVLKASSYYQTAPVGPADQPDFLNGAFLVATWLSAHELLEYLLKIERSQGRMREIKDGPRTLDLDLIFFGDEVFKTEDLTIPHPRAHERKFVLKPIAEIAPDWVHPIINKTVHQLLADMTIPVR